MKRILVIQTAFLGDVVLATAVLEKLHKTYPDAELHFLVRKGNQVVIENHPYLTKIWVLNKSQKFKSLNSIIKSLRREKFDLAVNLQRFFTSGLITILSGAKIKVGFDKNPLSRFFDYKHKHVINENHKTHEVVRNHQLIKQYTDSNHTKPRLYPSDSNFESIEKYIVNEPFICIAPASIWYTKQFPKEKWIEFLNQIEKKLTVYLIGAPNDQHLCHEIKSAVNNAIVNIQVLAGKLKPLESVALMSKAKMNYVNDSAPMHFASAINAPVTVMYCSTVPNFGFGPLSDISTVIETKEKLDCRPCGLHGYKTCPKGHFKCALTINTELMLPSI